MYIYMHTYLQGTYLIVSNYGLGVCFFVLSNILPGLLNEIIDYMQEESLVVAC